MRKWMIAAAGILSMAAPLFGQEKVVIGGSGALMNELPQLIQTYQSRYPSDSVEIFKQSMSTTGGIEGTKLGRFTVRLVTRRPEDQERGNLVYRVIARAPVVVAVGKTVTLNNLTEAQVCDIFSGRTKNWKELGGADLKIQVLGRKKDDANLEALQKQMPCFAGVKITAEAVLLDRGSEVDRSLANRPGTIGVTDFESALRGKDGFKTLTIEGVAPATDSMASARYPYFREFGVVTVGEPQGAVKRFLEFMVGQESQKVLAQSGVVVGKYTK